MSSKKGIYLRIDEELLNRVKEKSEQSIPKFSVQQLIEQFLIQYDLGHISFKFEAETPEESIQ